MTIHDTSGGGRPPAEGWHDVRAGTTRESGFGTTCCVPGARRALPRSAQPDAAPARRRLDHILPARGLPAIGYFAGVIALLGLAQLLRAPAYLLVDAVAFLAAGSWCGLNFWRCRQAHCVVSAAGWLALTVFVFVEAALGRSLIHGDEQAVFLVVLVAAVAFEGAWYVARGTNALTARPRR